ncbi:uncharacterized protein [Cicer arietinum]|uniref:Uncharacterized protein LOC105851771 n=1 Tax=Cicer arietinum TaxID=3827 RepID=A0A1S3DZP8_CICAR|nr:uncharacterized protein LOC105851771 [Cicer arietinum]
METIPAYHENSLINGIMIFYRLFWAFVPCISAFKFCKPMVQVDGTWLYDKYKGTLLVAVAQDGNDNVIPIAYAIVEGETKEGWSFFLRNLRKFVTPQANICLISDRHESIKSAYNNPNNGWQDPPSKHMFCVRHIAQNFTREFKDNALKKKVISMGYSINEPTYRYYRREIDMLNPDSLKWLDNIPRQDWIQAFDGGSRWGQMTTNLVESINAVLKGPRNLPITALVQSTYFKTGTLFPTTGKQHASILASGQVYTKPCIDFMKFEISKSNSHRVDSFDRSNHTFMVHETVVPREGRPIAACSSIKYNYWSLIPDVYKVESVLKVYDEVFQPIPNQGYWPQYEGVKPFDHLYCSVPPLSCPSLLDPLGNGILSIADLLYIFIFTALLLLSPSSAINSASHTTLHAPMDATTYSTSQVDNATMLCFLEHHEIGD